MEAGWDGSWPGVPLAAPVHQKQQQQQQQQQQPDQEQQLWRSGSAVLHGSWEGVHASPRGHRHQDSDVSDTGLTGDQTPRKQQRLWRSGDGGTPKKVAGAAAEALCDSMHEEGAGTAAAGVQPGLAAPATNHVGGPHAPKAHVERRTRTLAGSGCEEQEQAATAAAPRAGAARPGRTGARQGSSGAWPWGWLLRMALAACVAALLLASGGFMLGQLPGRHSPLQQQQQQQPLQQLEQLTSLPHASPSPFRLPPLQQPQGTPPLEVHAAQPSPHTLDTLPHLHLTHTQPPPVTSKLPHAPPPRTPPPRPTDKLAPSLDAAQRAGAAEACPAYPLLHWELLHAIQDPLAQPPCVCFVGVSMDVLERDLMLRELRFQQARWHAAQQQGRRAGRRGIHVGDQLAEQEQQHRGAQEPLPPAGALASPDPATAVPAASDMTNTAAGAAADGVDVPVAQVQEPAQAMGEEASVEQVGTEQAAAEAGAELAGTELAGAGVELAATAAGTELAGMEQAGVVHAAEGAGAEQAGAGAEWAAAEVVGAGARSAVEEEVSSLSATRAARAVLHAAPVGAAHAAAAAAEEQPGSGSLPLDAAAGALSLETGHPAGVAAAAAGDAAQPAAANTSAGRQQQQQQQQGQLATNTSAGQQQQQEGFATNTSAGQQQQEQEELATNTSAGQQQQQQQQERQQEGLAGVSGGASAEAAAATPFFSDSHSDAPVAMSALEVEAAAASIQAADSPSALELGVPAAGNEAPGTDVDPPAAGNEAPGTDVDPPAASTTASSHKGSGLLMALVAALAACASAAACMLVQTGHASIGSARVLPSLQQAACAAWRSAHTLREAARLLRSTAAEAAAVAAPAIAASGAAHALRGAASAAARSLTDAPAHLQACAQHAQGWLASAGLWCASSLWPLAERGLAVAAAAADTAVQGAATAYQASTAAWVVAGPWLRDAAGSCREAARATGPQLHVAAGSCVQAGRAGGRVACVAVRRLAASIVCMGAAAQPHLSSAADAALNSAAAAVVAVGLGGGAEAEQQEGQGLDEEVDKARLAGMLQGTASSSGRILRLRSGASMGQPGSTQQGATPGTVGRNPRSRFARRTPRRYLEDEEAAAQHELWQQQREAQEAAIHASEREALLGRAAAAAAAAQQDELLGSASPEHMWLRGRLVLRQAPASVGRQRRREDHTRSPGLL